MTNADLIQQIARILALIFTPLLIKWGIDSESAAAIVTGAAGLVGSLVWWFFWVRNKAKA